MRDEGGAAGDRDQRDDGGRLHAKPIPPLHAKRGGRRGRAMSAARSSGDMARLPAGPRGRQQRMAGALRGGEGARTRRLTILQPSLYRLKGQCGEILHAASHIIVAASVAHHDSSWHHHHGGLGFRRPPPRSCPARRLPGLRRRAPIPGAERNRRTPQRRLVPGRRRRAPAGRRGLPGDPRRRGARTRSSTSPPTTISPVVEDPEYWRTNVIGLRHVLDASAAQRRPPLRVRQLGAGVPGPALRARHHRREPAARPAHPTRPPSARARP